MNYEQAIKLLTSQAKFRIELGLERVKAILNIFDNPQNKIKIIHIAGTNGKGSVACSLANILKHAGYKTGLYTSPHIVKYTERIKINNIDISENNFAEYIEETCNLAEINNVDLTEFEILTISAFKYFYDEKVDIAVIETGLGGRFDATNAIKDPVLSIITSISLDHTDRLGNTIEEIAFEKSGIIKENSNVIISDKNKGFDVIRKQSEKKHSKVIEAKEEIITTLENEKNYIIYNNEKYEFGLIGTYQNQNTALILKAVEFLNSNNFGINKNSLEQGLKTVKWPARLEYIKEKNLIIDGAHNPDAAIELRKSLDFYFPNQKRTFIYSTLNTKDYISIAKILFNKDDIIYYLEFNHKNAVPFDIYQTAIKQHNIEKIDILDVNRILEDKSLKIICGSLYMIGSLYYNIKDRLIKNL